MRIRTKDGVFVGLGAILRDERGCRYKVAAVAFPIDDTFEHDYYHPEEAIEDLLFVSCAPPEVPPDPFPENMVRWAGPTWGTL